MTKKYQLKRILMRLYSLILVAVVGGAFGFLWNSYYNSTIVRPFFYYGNLLLVAVYSVVFVLFTRSFGGFKIGYYKALGLIGSLIISVVCTNIVTYFQISLIARGFLPVAKMLLLTVADIALVALWSAAGAFLYKKMFPARKMIIVYGSKSARDLVVKMSSRMDKYIICTSVSSDRSLEEIEEKISEYEAVIICDVPAAVRSKLLKFTFDRSIRTYINPKISDIIIRGAEEFHMFDTPLLLARNHEPSFEVRAAKRLVDVVLALIGLAVASPFMAVLAIMIKLYDGGPVLYTQRRLTKGGRVFKLYKFRSMIPNAEEDGVARLAADSDSRITPVGKIMRRCRLDELPQLVNILKGDMSFVGPRPERPEIAAEYEKTMPEFSYRLKVKAGLTGFAQVFGKYNTSPYDKLKLDLMYIERQSFLLDFRIMLMTLRTVFVPDAAEGVKSSPPLPDEPDGDSVIDGQQKR